MTEQLLLRPADGIFEIILNRPERYNAITDAMLTGMREAADSFASRRDLRVLLIRANGKYFSSGADLSPELSPNVGASTLDGRL